MIKAVLTTLGMLFLLQVGNKAIAVHPGNIYGLNGDTTKHRQTRKKLPPGNKRHKDEDEDCVFVNKYTVNQLLRKYPYLKAAKIMAVSYHYWEPHPKITIDDTVNIDSTPATVPENISRTNQPDTIFKSGLHINNGKLNYSSLVEFKELSAAQINKLTHIIYNTKTRVPSNYPSVGHSCYSPRNALIFFDSKGRVFDYLAVCFECMQYRSQSDKITIGNGCNQKFDLLKNFFEEVGVKFGIIEKD